MQRPTRRSIPLALVLGAFLLAADPAQAAPAPAAAPTPADSAEASLLLVDRLLAPVTVAGRARDSLSRLADSATGIERDVLEEQLWQRHLEFQGGLVEAASELEELRSHGTIAPEAQARLNRALQTGWPRYVGQLDRRGTRLETMSEELAELSGSERLAAEARLTTFVERTIHMYQDVIDAMLALERLGLDVTRQRAWVTKRLVAAATQTVARLNVQDRQLSRGRAHAQRAPDDAAARVELDALELGQSRSMATLETEIELLERLGQDVTALHVQQVLLTGKLTSAALRPGVLSGLAKHAEQQFLEMLQVRLPQWIFQGLVLVVVFVVFRLLAGLVRKGVSRLVTKTSLTQLMRDTMAAWSWRLVMFVGLIVLLRQIGVQVGPMLAGVGLAGVVVGFALQDTLANFASGAMILAYHPFDVGDIVQAGGVEGVVHRMSLVSTTILTFDNQTLVVPNRKVWGDVIRNVSTQGTRRVDLTFGVAYDSDLEKVERVLLQIVEADERVLRDPAPIIRLHKLADWAMEFVVRIWVQHDLYWNVYWDTTRSVKLAFDREGIKIPFPTRELHMQAPGAAPAVTRSEGPV